MRCFFEFISKLVKLSFDGLAELLHVLVHAHLVLANQLGAQQILFPYLIYLVIQMPYFCHHFTLNRLLHILNLHFYPVLDLVGVINVHEARLQVLPVLLNLGVNMLQPHFLLIQCVLGLILKLLDQFTELPPLRENLVLDPRIVVVLVLRHLPEPRREAATAELRVVYYLGNDIADVGEGDLEPLGRIFQRYGNILPPTGIDPVRQKLIRHPELLLPHRLPEDTPVTDPGQQQLLAAVLWVP